MWVLLVRCTTYSAQELSKKHAFDHQKNKKNNLIETVPCDSSWRRTNTGVDHLLRLRLLLSPRRPRLCRPRPRFAVPHPHPCRPLLPPSPHLSGGRAPIWPSCWGSLLLHRSLASLAWREGHFHFANFVNCSAAVVMMSAQMQAQKMQVRPALLHSHVFSWAASSFTNR